MRRIARLVALGATLAAQAWGLTADEQMRFADGIYLRGFYETAVGEYLALLRDHPGSPHTAAALYRTGECYRQMGNPLGADRFYNRVVAEFPADELAARARLRQAEAAIAAGRYAEAAAQLDELHQGAPAEDTAVAASYYRAFARWKSGDADKASGDYARFLETHPQSPYAAYAALDLASIHARDKNRDQEMTAWFEKAAAVAANPALKAEALFRWGDWAYRQERYASAADILQTLLVELPGEPRARDARLAAAWSLYYLDRTAEALTLAEQLLESASDPETAASGVYLRANCLRKMNRDGEALGDYQRVVRDYPGNTLATRAAYEIMVTHFKRGEYDQALVAAPPQPEPANAADVLWMRAESERLLGRLDLARGRYEALTREYPRSPQAAASLLRLGEMAREAGRMAEAAALFSRLAAEYPKHEAAPEALKAAALARSRSGDNAGALADWDTLLDRKLEPAARAEARLQKALVLIELKKSAEAQAELDRLLKDRSSGPEAARAQYWRGVLFAEQAKWPQAEEALRASLAGGPDAGTAALARLRLAVALQRQDRMDEAADQIDPLLGDAALVADNPALVEWQARHRFDQGQFERCLAAAQALGAKAREASWRQIGWYWAGAAQAQLGRDAEAADAYGKAMAEKAATREGAEAGLLLAGLDLKAGRLEKAAERYAAAAETARGDSAQDLRVRAYFGLGETAEAAGNLEKAARHFLSVAVLFDDPEWTPHGLSRAARLYEKLGQSSAQAQAIRELRERYPDSSFAHQLNGNPP